MIQRASRTCIPARPGRAGSLAFPDCATPRRRRGFVSTRLLIAPGIAVFWAVMMGMLLKKEVIPVLAEMRRASLGTTYDLLLHQSVPRSIQMGLYFGRRRVGTAQSRIIQQRGTWRIHSTVKLDGGLFGHTRGRGPAMKIIFDGYVGPDSRLIRFRLEAALAFMNKPMLTMSGVVLGPNLHIVTKVGGLPAGQAVMERTIPFDSRQVIGNDLCPLLGVPELYVGRHWEVRSINPMTMSLETARARVIAMEQMIVREDPTDVYVVRIKSRHTESKVWVTEIGEVVKQTLPFGLTMVSDDVQQEGEAAVDPGARPAAGPPSR